MAKMEHTQQKWAELDWNWRLSYQNNIRWSERFGYFFLEISKNLSKTVRSVNFFIALSFIAKRSRPTKNEHNWTKIDDLMTKTILGDRKSSDTFLEISEN